MTPVRRARQGPASQRFASTEKATECAGSSGCSASRRRSRSGWGAPRRDARPDERPRSRQRGRRGLPRPGADRVEQGVAVLSRPGRGLGGGRAGSPTRSAATRSPRSAPATPCSWSRPTPTRPRRWLREHHPELRIMSAGRAHRDLQGDGPADRVRQALRARRDPGQPRARPHAHGDREPRDDRATRTRSRPASTSASSTTARSPTTTACGRELRREGIEFQTDNDTEVAAGYLTWRLREGASLEQALEGCLDDLDGFYTFAVGTADGFAVLRDPIACKPAVMAETDDWVAMASEYRAIAVLPGAEDAQHLGARAGARSTSGSGSAV